MALSPETISKIQKGVLEIINGPEQSEGEVAMIDGQIASLQKRRNDILKEIDSLRLNFKKAFDPKTLEELFPKVAKYAPSPIIRSNMKIGDAMEMIIKAEGAQFQKDLIAKIRNVGIRISEKSPYVVMGYVINHDSRTRFQVLEDGRVGLVGVKEKTRSDVSRKRANKQKQGTYTKGKG